ncbi:MAG: rod shape-determining protein MreD [Kiritimatiellae bacterium]|jgi:rod shape-determining protein MreD|nr:rod shape-determining protein MreD [Kiritimatiellia bacterium]
MNRLVLWASLLACAMIQAILPAWQSMGQAKPPILLGAVLYYALSRHNFQVLEASILAGLLQDSLGPIPHGFSVLAFVAVALLINQYRERIFGEHWFTHVILGVGASVLVTLILYILLMGAGLRREVSFAFVMTKALGMSLLGIVIFPLVYKLIETLDVSLGNRLRREL